MNNKEKRLSGGLRKGPVWTSTLPGGRKTSKCVGMIALGIVFITVNQGCQIGEIWALGLTLEEQAGNPWPRAKTNETRYKQS